MKILMSIQKKTLTFCKVQFLENYLSYQTSQKIYTSLKNKSNKNKGDKEDLGKFL